MIYRVLFTKEAKEDIKDIYEYISYALLEPTIAKGQITRIISMINSLNEMPMRFKLCEVEPWCNLGLRVVPVDNYLVFYLPDVNEKTVKIIRIMYSGRDINIQL